MANTARIMGNGDVGEPLKLTVQADAALKTAIDALIAAGTEIKGLFVKFDNTTPYVVSLQGDQEAPQLYVTSWRLNKADNTYDLGVEVLQNCVKVLPYRNGNTVTLGAHVRVEGADYKYIETDAAATVGIVLRKNTTDETADVLFT